MSSFNKEAMHQEIKKIPTNYGKKRHSFPCVRSNALFLNNHLYSSLNNNTTNSNSRLFHTPHFYNMNSNFHKMDLFLKKNVKENEHYFHPIQEYNKPEQSNLRYNPINLPNLQNEIQKCNGFKLIESDSKRVKNNFNLPVPGFMNNPFLLNKKTHNENNFKIQKELIKKRSYNELNGHMCYPVELHQKKHRSFSKIQGGSLTSNCSPKPLKIMQHHDGIFFSNQKHFAQNSTNGSNNQNSRRRSKGDSNNIPAINSLEKSSKMILSEDHKTFCSLMSELKEICQLEVSNDEFRQKMLIFISKWNYILANSPNNPRYPSIDFL